MYNVGKADCFKMKESKTQEQRTNKIAKKKTNEQLRVQGLLRKSSQESKNQKAEKRVVVAVKSVSIRDRGNPNLNKRPKKV
jgi:hypothetical protein